MCFYDFLTQPKNLPADRPDDLYNFSPDTPLSALLVYEIVRSLNRLGAQCFDPTDELRYLVSMSDAGELFAEILKGLDNEDVFERYVMLLLKTAISYRPIKLSTLPDILFHPSADMCDANLSRLVKEIYQQSEEDFFVRLVGQLDGEVAQQHYMAFLAHQFITSPEDAFTQAIPRQLPAIVTAMISHPSASGITDDDLRPLAVQLFESPGGLLSTVGMVIDLDSIGAARRYFSLFVPLFLDCLVSLFTRTDVLSLLACSLGALYWYKVRAFLGRMRVSIGGSLSSWASTTAQSKPQQKPLSTKNQSEGEDSLDDLLEELSKKPGQEDATLEEVDKMGGEEKSKGGMLWIFVLLRIMLVGGALYYRRKE